MLLATHRIGPYTFVTSMRGASAETRTWFNGRLMQSYRSAKLGYEAQHADRIEAWMATDARMWPRSGV